jgi:excisionase family DNA binding protein
MADYEDKLLSVAAVAQLLGVTEPTVREWIKDGKLRAYRAGARFWRIRQSEVNRMLGNQVSDPERSPRSGLRPTPGEQTRDLISSLITNPQRSDDAG